MVAVDLAGTGLSSQIFGGAAALVHRDTNVFGVFGCIGAATAEFALTCDSNGDECAWQRPACSGIQMCSVSSATLDEPVVGRLLPGPGRQATRNLLGQEVPLVRTEVLGLQTLALVETSRGTLQPFELDS